MSYLKNLAVWAFGNQITSNIKVQCSITKTLKKSNFSLEINEALIFFTVKQTMQKYYRQGGTKICFENCVTFEKIQLGTF